MTPDLQREFQSLSDQAHKTLREIPVCGSFREVFSFWKFPSFSPSSRCTVYTPWRWAEERHLPMAAISIWRSDLDLEKLKSPVERLKYPKDLSPTIENATVNLSKEDILKFEERLAKFTIPFYLGGIEGAVGADGTRYEFTYDRFSSGASLRWWSETTPEWRPFISIILQIHREIEARLRAKE